MARHPRLHVRMPSVRRGLRDGFRRGQCRPGERPRIRGAGGRFRRVIRRQRHRGVASVRALHRLLQRHPQDAQRERGEVEDRQAAGMQADSLRRADKQLRRHRRGVPVRLQDRVGNAREPPDMSGEGRAVGAHRYPLVCRLERQRQQDADAVRTRRGAGGLRLQQRRRVRPDRRRNGEAA